MVDIGSGKFLHRSSFSLPVLVGVCLHGQFPHIGLSWNLPAVPDIFGEPPPTFDGTSSKAHQLEMSLIHKLYYFFVFPTLWLECVEFISFLFCSERVFHGYFQFHSKSPKTFIDFSFTGCKT